MGTLGGIPLDVGDILAKKYRLERLVGEGGTGVVVAARHMQLEREVAIKFLRTALASDEIRLRFEREAHAIGQIESEHVVLVLEVGALDDGCPYMVMEYLEGRDLAKTLKEDGPLSVEDAADCMLQVCEALDGAHAQGIIHRDLKPANLFLTRREDGGPHIKVVDFGISKLLDPKLKGDSNPLEVTSAFTVLGSPRYMAPEQLRNSKDVDGRADLWSLGAVLFQLLTGKYAFDAENNVHASLAVLTTEAPLVRALAPHVPPELEAVVNKCLTKDRERRFQTAAELADALRPFASERTRESLERLQQAKQAPSLNIALGVSSEGERIDRGATASSTGLTVPLHPPSSPRLMPGGGGGGGGAGVGAAEPALAAVVRKTSPAMIKLAIAGAGVLAVLLAFGVLTLVKSAAVSMGVLSSVSADPSTPPPPAAAAPASSFLASGAGSPRNNANQHLPSQALTVTLDAGRPPP
jgi:serine/threonine-protein kinase